MSPTSSTTSTTSMLQKIAANSLMATAKFQSLKFDMDFSLSMDLPTGGQTTTMNMQETATTSVNIPNKEMDMTTNMVLEIPNQNKQNVSGEIYSQNGYIYMKTTTAGIDQWTKMKMTDEMWAMQSRISSMTDFLKSPINLELVGSENIKGVDCYVLSINPDIQALTNWMEGQIQPGQTGINLNNVDISKILQNFTVKEWIYKDSYLLAKQQIGIKLNTNSGVSTTSPDTTAMNMDMNATLTFYDYGQPVTIQLPPEALNAKELTQP